MLCGSSYDATGLSAVSDCGIPDHTHFFLSAILDKFMWSELGIDSDDLIIDPFHRLGLLHKAKQRQQTDNPRRPIIIAFRDYSDIERILSRYCLMFMC